LKTADRPRYWHRRKQDRVAVGQEARAAVFGEGLAPMEETFVAATVVCDTAQLPECVLDRTDTACELECSGEPREECLQVEAPELQVPRIDGAVAVIAQIPTAKQVRHPFAAPGAARGGMALRL